MSYITTFFKIVIMAVIAIIILFIGVWFLVALSVVLVITLAYALVFDGEIRMSEEGKDIGYWKRSTGFVEKSTHNE